ncbi:MAG: alkaline phytoceramidase [Candidatus Rokubacteria bacterium]|nr:alkaline phytoceramidase [Candidatus Rokubacteria bacterium]
MLLVLIVVAAVQAVYALPPIAQDPGYHAFADQRELFGIPNFLNVASNVGFVLVGALGARFMVQRGRPRPDGPVTVSWERLAWLVLFAGVGLAGLGSARYHLAPSDASLVWDRLPITLVFTTLLAINAAERIGLRAGRWLLPPLLVLGAGSVAAWHLGGGTGIGDLRAYGLVQFLPPLLVPVMLLLFRPRYTRGGAFAGALGWYALAKALEALDAEVFALGALVSGHTLKHLAAALAMYWILRMLRRRQPVPHSGAGVAP